MLKIISGPRRMILEASLVQIGRSNSDMLDAFKYIDVITKILTKTNHFFFLSKWDF